MYVTMHIYNETQAGKIQADYVEIGMELVRGNYAFFLTNYGYCSAEWVR
jgi:hypothetical protein